jgi:pimeloyl-ACP methyl ester carboxylesterase
LRKDLANIQVHVIILYGVKDRVCLFVLAQVILEIIKGSQIVQIEKAGHNGFYFEELQIFNLELVKFIDYPSFFMIEGLWFMGNNHPGNDNYERYT